MSVDPLGRLARDLDAAARDMDDVDLSAASEGLAVVVREEIPVATGYARSTVGAYAEGVTVTAPYAGFIRDPYVERALDKYDPTGPVADEIDGVLDRHIQTLYV